VVDCGDGHPLSPDEAPLMIENRKVVVIESINGRVEATIIDGETIKITQRNTLVFFNAKLIHKFIEGLMEIAQSVPLPEGKQSHG
jgi:hypothetical protein